MKVSGETAIVTGGASGLGAATAAALLAAGAKVAVLDRAIEHESTTADGLLRLPCDVTSETGAEAALARLTERLGSPRILVNCAGIIEARKVLSRKGLMSLDHFRQVVEVHLVGTFNMIRLFADAVAKLPALNPDGERGVIVNTSSVAAFDGQIGAVSYSSAKAGVAGLTLPLAREFAEHGIRVMAIAPGVFETPMAGQLSDKAKTQLIAAVPFPHRFGDPKEYAELVLFICNNAMMNGEVIRIDAATRMP